MVAATLFVLIVETLNTAVEAAIDRIGSEYHELSGLAKDLGSFAVTLSLILWLVIWIPIVWDNYLLFPDVGSDCLSKCWIHL